MRDGWRYVALREVMQIDIQRVPVVADIDYDLAGVYSFGRGLFRRDRLPGSATTYRYLHRLRAGQLVMSKLKAWEGALTVVTNEFDTAVLSPEFPTYSLRTEELAPAYAHLLATRPEFWALVAAQSRGMGGRKERVHQDRLLDVSVAIPPLPEQLRIVNLAGAVDDVVKKARRAVDGHRRLHDDLVEVLISRPAKEYSWPVVELGAIADVRLGFTKGDRHGDLVPAPYLRAANLGKGELRVDDIAAYPLHSEEVVKHSVHPGDLLMTEGGNPWDLGRGWVWEGQVKGCVHQNSVIRATSFDPGASARYVGYVLQSGPLRLFFESRALQTSGIAHLGLRGAAVAPIPLPDRSQQERIAAVLDAAREAVIAARSVEQAATGLWNALVGDLLSGDHEITESYDRFLVGAS